MTESKRAAKPASDEDEAPELTDEWFDGADLYHGDKFVRRGRGRPRSEATKEQVTLRLDRDVLAHSRQGGPGWQSRLNAALRTLLPGS